MQKSLLQYLFLIWLVNRYNLFFILPLLGNLETENRFVLLTKERKIGLHLVVQIKAALLVG